MAAIYKKHATVISNALKSENVKSYKDLIRKDYENVLKKLTDPEFYETKIRKMVKKRSEEGNDPELKEWYKVHRFNAASGRLLSTPTIAILKQDLDDMYGIKWKFEREGNDEAGTLYFRFKTEAENIADLHEDEDLNSEI